MANYGGQFGAGTTWQEPPSWSRSPQISALSIDHPPPFASFRVSAPLTGSRTDTQPVDERQANFGGTRGVAFGAYWFDRIHIVPSSLSLGNLISNTTRQFEVWNAWTAQKTLASITATGATAGLTLSGPPSPPLAYGPLQSFVYTLTAVTAGDPVIDAKYTFVFGAESPQLTVTGRRVVVWSFRPNWEDGVTERLTWLTDVLAHRDGTEQRIRLRDHAARRIEYRFMVHGHDARVLEALTFGWGARTYALPVWWEADVLASAVSAGATSVGVTDAALKDYAVGGFLALWRDTTTCEVAEIVSIIGNTITVKSPITQSFPAGSRVMPAVLARIEGDAPRARVTDRIVVGSATFLVENATDRVAAEIGPTWNGYAVLDARPDRAQDVDESWARTLQVLDYLTGMVTVEDLTGAPVIRRTYTWSFSGRSAINTWKKWAAARAGRYRALWLPTWADDLELMLPVGATDTALRVRNTLSARYVGAHALRAAVRIELRTGQVFHRLVTGISELDATSESLGIDSALGIVVQPEDVRAIMWMPLVRLDADTVEIVYETDSVARIQATFRAVVQ